MKLLLALRHPPKAQSVWRALLAGVLGHLLSAAFFIVVYWLLRPFVWAAIYSESYRSPPGPYPPDSGEWLFAQGIGFCSWIIAGALTAHWSPPRSKMPIALLVALSIGAPFVTQFPLNASVFRNAIYALHTPVGLVLGAVLLWRWRLRNDAQSGKDRLLTGPPHTTRHAGPHRAVHEQGAHDFLMRSRGTSSKDHGHSPVLAPSTNRSSSRLASPLIVTDASSSCC